MLTVLLALAGALLTPAGTAAAGTTTGISTTNTAGARSLLDGTWYVTNEPWVRSVFTGAQGVMEVVRDGPDIWEILYRSECMGGRPAFYDITEITDINDVTGSGLSFTGMGVSNYGCSYESTFTKVRFDISAADSETLALVVTYGEVRDEWVPAYANYYTRPGTLPPIPEPSPEPLPEPPPADLQCGQGDTALTLTPDEISALIQTVTSSGLFDPAATATIQTDPCVLMQLSVGEPSSSVGTPHQHSEPIAGPAAQVWHCAPYTITWPIRINPTQAVIGHAQTVTDACTDGRTISGGNPAATDPPVPSPPTISLNAPFDSLWSHELLGNPTGRWAGDGLRWEYRQVVEYKFLHLPTGGQDIAYEYSLSVPFTPNTPPLLHAITPT
ncbi:MAG: hypothetical protein AVDCRST_MAG66-1606 [uncultured Pseudonocardia sp.]|uniref:Uncharacterized protein n=1 Tax=uncultured Pseudonocardia sp. TaxID=211455 RepID=A0A6J4P202_9PSEU|nr:MAG: hypothetical protein AVDCRST_MAG66-1606 [uncultured Pseudonocardia sp.]